MQIIDNEINGRASTVHDLSDKWYVYDTGARLFRLMISLGMRATEFQEFRWLELGPEDIESHEIFNYTQVFKKTAYGGSDVRDKAYQRKKRILEMCRDIERTLFYGYRQEVGDPYTHRTSGGLSFFLPVIRLPQVTTAQEFRELASFITNKCTSFSMPFVFTSPEWLDKVINRILNPGEMKVWDNVRYGFPIFYIESKINVLTGELSKINFVADRFVQPNDLFVVNLEDLVFRYFKNRNIQYIENAITRDAYDEPLLYPNDVVLCECGLEVHNSQKHFRIIFGGQEECSTSNQE